MDRLGVTVSPTRKAGAWVATKLTEFKLAIDDPTDGALRVLESLEVLTMGIDGKGALWHALAASRHHFPELDAIDFDRLIERAEEQGTRVEHARLQAAMQVFVPDE
jgi:hypothetical protein